MKLYTNIVVLFGDDHLQAVRYIRKAEIICQEPLDLVSINGWNTIRRMIDKNLGQASCLHEVKHYKRMEHGMRWGDILRKNEAGLLVELEIEEGQPIIAQCPWNRIGVHEQKELFVGQKRAFHLRRIDPIAMRGTTRVQVVVDRVSKNLVIGLLRNQLGEKGRNTEIRCAKRYVGHKSFVETSHLLPKKVIKEVSRELREHIQVTVWADSTAG